jgi:beta-glucosidase
MRHTFLTVVLMLSAMTASAQRAIPRDAKLEASIEKTLARMTLDEKIGQMLQLNFDIMGKYDATGRWQLNETMLDTCLSKYKVGSILNAPATRAATARQWQHWIRLIPSKSTTLCPTIRKATRS